MIRAVWASFWGELNTPSNYRADPYGAAANQLAHWGGGVAAAGAFCLIWLLCFGQMPFRLMVLCIVTGAYFFLVELVRQRWQGADSITDTMFVSLGASFALFSLEEVAFIPELRLDARPEAGLSILGASLIIYAAHIYPRAVRKRRAGA